MKKYNFKLFILPIILSLLTLVIIKNTKPIYEGNFKIKVGQFKSFNDRPLIFVLRPEENFVPIIPAKDVYNETKDPAFLANIIQTEKYNFFAPDFRAKYFNDTLIVDVDTVKNIVAYRVKSYSPNLTNLLSKDILEKIINSHKELYQGKLKLINDEIVFYDNFINSLNKEKSDVQKGLVWDLFKSEKLLNALKKKSILQEALESKLSFTTFVLQQPEVLEYPVFPNKKLILTLVFSMAFILSLGIIFIIDLKE